MDLGKGFQKLLPYKCRLNPKVWLRGTRVTLSSITGYLFPIPYLTVTIAKGAIAECFISKKTIIIRKTSHQSRSTSNLI